MCYDTCSIPKDLATYLLDLIKNTIKEKLTFTFKIKKVFNSTLITNVKGKLIQTKEDNSSKVLYLKVITYLLLNAMQNYSVLRLLYICDMIKGSNNF